jgi:hypothetical protein
VTVVKCWHVIERVENKSGYTHSFTGSAEFPLITTVQSM